ncbi:hypothetical protein PMI04_004185 [Sphingobium sp. AP49]|uniref:hypothetical protein n=1 Tax=Sphingobium sp. AP49 TaxID=1144307 RepID=UPI0012F6B812|nr:hypothetical protein [Sphingobium sp. AP49]WHO39796.1 hypothetical protein PMI04_004185 [Sphingobium sp. AP49]
MSAASAGPEKAPGRTIHATSPGTGVSGEWKSCLMQRQPVEHRLERQARADVYNQDPQRTFLKWLVLPEYEGVAVMGAGSNGPQKDYVFYMTGAIS